MDQFVSIIIPCHQAEAFIDRCFQSLAAQTIGMGQLELIFVDQASTDRTWQRLQAIEQQAPSSVMIIHCEEPASPGEIALSYASCSYVSFVEPDAWISPFLYQMLCTASGGQHYDLVSDRMISSTNGTLIHKALLEQYVLFYPEAGAFESDFLPAFLSIYASDIYLLKQDLSRYYMSTSSSCIKSGFYSFSDFLTLNLRKWKDWEQQGFMEQNRQELEYLFLSSCLIGSLKRLFSEDSDLPFDRYLLLRQAILDRIPDYTENPYISVHFSDFEQLLLQLPATELSGQDLNEIACLTRKNQASVKVFVATHVVFQPPADSVYVPIQVGSADSADLGYVRDNIGDNISDLNCYYSELTGLYWIWKNYAASDYIGLCHYRRYFMDDNHRILSRGDYIRLLSRFDVILSKPYLHETSYYENYQEAHHIEDLLAVERAIRKLYPEQLDVFQAVVHGHVSYVGNLFVTSRRNFGLYAQWLFSIFDEASRYIQPDVYDAYHKRVYGFLSEQLLFVWVKAMRLTYYECPYGLSQEKEETMQLKSRLYELLMQGHFSEAKEQFLAVTKNRPDVLLETADLTNELRLLYQIITVSLKEQEQGNPTLLSWHRDYAGLISHYKHVLEILAHAHIGSLTDSDKAYLKQTGVSLCALNTIIGFTPSYQSLDPEDILC